MTKHPCPACRSLVDTLHRETFHLCSFKTHSHLSRLQNKIYNQFIGHKKGEHIPQLVPKGTEEDGFWSLLPVASMPVVQVLLIGILGALLATDYVNILSIDTCRDINKIVYAVFSPSLMFASLLKTVSFETLLSWWFMLVNIGITFLVGGVLGWLATKLIRTKPHLKGVIIANCAAGNLGNMPLIVIPAICNENGNPFGKHSICSSRGLSYVSLSMALGNVYIWTIAYALMKEAGKIYKDGLSDSINSNEDVSDESHICTIEAAELHDGQKACENDPAVPLLSKRTSGGRCGHLVRKVKEILYQVGEELTTPPIMATIVGFIAGAIPWFKSLLIGETAVFRVVQDSLLTLGQGSVPCITLILGGNLTSGVKKNGIKPLAIIAIIIVRYIILPVAGIFVMKGASKLGILPHDPLYTYVLLLQYTLPPAMGIGVLAQIFNVGKEECSVIFLWTYLIAAVAVTFWSTVFLSIVS